MNLTPIFTPLAGLPVWLIALLVPLMLLCLACLIWAVLPRRAPRSHPDIERQIATLRRTADKAVTHRPRVRANGCCQPAPTHIKATPKVVAPHKPCGGGLCRHRADCADRYCPGRPSIKLPKVQNHAQH